jgi:uracil-DNA glycosylase
MEAQVPVNPVIHQSWLNELKDEFEQPYFKELKAFLVRERQLNTVYPPGRLIFSAFNRTPFDKVEVVILGQDPYHGPGQANGLCFSVSDGIAMPPSLVNIFKEIQNDLGYPIPKSGNLESWADQGVLLLNAILTVRANEPASHHEKGWEKFTDKAIQKLSLDREGIIFMLWGKYAQAKEKLINPSKHHILKAAHPSPFSAYNGFMGCKHFSKANELLKAQGRHEIDWH